MHHHHHFGFSRPARAVQTTRRGLLSAIAGAGMALAMGGASSVQAAEYPTHTITMVVPFTPGGSTDVAGRVLAKAMSESMQQTIAVENRSGAAGAVGIGQVARANPDGYTLGVGGVGPMVTLKLLGRDITYDPAADLDVAGHMGALGLAIVADDSLKANNIKELVALAKASPGKLSYGTSGIGSPGHLAFEQLKALTGMEIEHIPYRGDAPLTTDLMGGQLDIGVLTVPGAVAQAQSNRLKMLAVTSAKRAEQLPDVPTVAESGIPDYAAEIWNLLVVPKGTPEDIVQHLNKELNIALARDDVRQQFSRQGLMVQPMSVQEARDFVKAERKKWGHVIETTGAGKN